MGKLLRHKSLGKRRLGRAGLTATSARSSDLGELLRQRKTCSKKQNPEDDYELVSSSYEGADSSECWDTGSGGLLDSKSPGDDESCSPCDDEEADRGCDYRAKIV